MSVQHCGEKFLFHVQTAHLNESGMREWLEQDRAQRRRRQQLQALDTGPRVTRPLLRHERHWGLTEEEIAAREASEDEERYKQQLREINMGEKQRKNFYTQSKENKLLEAIEADKYEQMLASVYRRKRLERLSPEVRDKIDLERQFRERIHI